jgi:WD40 repeat protein
MPSEPPIHLGGKSRNARDGNGSSIPAIPDHELIRRIGQGAYGEVWLARNVLGGYRAIKIIYRNAFRDEHTYEREFRGIKKFEPISRTNDGLLDVLQAGRDDESGHYYYVMELADDGNAEPGIEHAEPAEGWSGSAPASAVVDPGSYAPKTLGHILSQRGRLSSGECVQFGLNLTLALGHLHRHGLIHRDIKPANIIFVHGIPKLADIGLVTTFDRTCSFVGTEGFIAPEGPTSPRADLYSLGKVLYEISTGRDRKDFPEPATGFGEATDSQASAELNSVILKACAVDPRDRYQSAEEFHADLAWLNSGRSVRWKRLVEKRLAFARKAGAVVGVIAALAISAYLFQRHQTREAIRLQRYTEELLAQRDVQHAENLFARGDASMALAHLAHVLRRHPDHRVAAERILAALTQRTFPRLETPPLVHPAPLTMARFSPDHQSVIGTTDSRTIHVWDARTGEERFPPVKREGRIGLVECSPDGTKIIAVSFDGTVCVLDARTGGLVTPVFQLDGPVRAIAVSPDNLIAIATNDEKVQLYRANTGEPVRPPVIQDADVNVIAFSRDSRWLAIGSVNGLIQLLEVDFGPTRPPLKVNGPVRLLQFSENGKWLASASLNAQAVDLTRDWQVQTWEVETGQALGEPLTHDHVKAVTFSPDHERIATADSDGWARVWEIATGKLLFALPHSSSVNVVAFSRDGRLILTGSVDQTARLWDASTGAPAAEPMLHEGSVIHVEFSGDGERVFTAGYEDKTAKVWSIRRNRSPGESLGHDFWVMHAMFNANGSEILTATGGKVVSASRGNPYSTGEQQAVIVWDAATRTKKLAPTIPRGAETMAARFTPGGPRALIANWQQPQWVRILDLVTGVPIAEDFQPESGIACADFSADGLVLATGSADRRVRIWNTRWGVSMTSAHVHQAPLNSIRFSPDNRMLVTASEDRTAMITDVATGQTIAGPLAHDASVWFAQFSPGNDMVLTVSLDYTAKIWSTNGALIQTLRHSAPVEYGEFSPDATRVVTASGDRTARIWSLATGQRLTELEHQNVVRMARFSPDGLRILTASLDHTAQLWDGTTGLKLAEPFRHGNWVTTASFSPDGRKAITASMDGTAKIWEVSTVTIPVPVWLPDLAEAVGGKRLNPENLPDPVPWVERVELNARLSNLPPTDPLTEWARSYCAEPALNVDVDP